MAERASWAVQQVSGVGVQSAEDVRHSMAALWTPAGAVTSRSGMVPTGTAAVPGSVLATLPTANTTVHVQPFRYVRQSSRGGGTYTMILDSIKDIDVLNPANGGTAADPSNARIDLIIAQQSDTFFGDANSNMVVKRVTGTPAGTPLDPTVTGSADYVLLARITVPANATTIQTANIANVALPSAVTVGGLLPVADATERAALANPFDGQQIYRRDLDWIEVYDGTAWRAPAFVKTASNASITNPYAGQYAQNTTDGQLYRYTGTAWVPARGIIAYGKRTSSSTAGNPTNVLRIDNVSLLSGRAYRVFTCAINLFGTANDTDSLNVWISTTGVAIAGDPNSSQLSGARAEGKLINGGGAAVQAKVDTTYIPGANQTASFLLTGERNTGSGTVQVYGDNTASPILLMIEDIGVAPPNTAVIL
ncbi:hypothetical protein [Amycolatopsis plumensis]|uniref:Minor tail protein n=1 Tax=Amycolatopsis plumensis TaxID=236508 RepID=A0ABV5U8J4_9PSEU